MLGDAGGKELNDSCLTTKQVSAAHPSYSSPCKSRQAGVEMSRLERETERSAGSTLAFDVRDFCEYEIGEWLKKIIIKN